jgi:hypothetical protein
MDAALVRELVHIADQPRRTRLLRQRVMLFLRIMP